MKEEKDMNEIPEEVRILQGLDEQPQPAAAQNGGILRYDVNGIPVHRGKAGHDSLALSPCVIKFVLGVAET